MHGGYGNDYLYGQNGSDDLWGGMGADYFNGGAGFDRARDWYLEPHSSIEYIS